MRQTPDHKPNLTHDFDLVDLLTFPSNDGKLEAKAIQGRLRAHWIESRISRSLQETAGLVVQVARGDLPEAQHLLRQERAATPEPESLAD